jgi:hypothetical protein
MPHERLTIHRLRAMAAEFDRISDGERFTAVEFVRFLELELDHLALQHAARDPLSAP